MIGNRIALSLFILFTIICKSQDNHLTIIIDFDYQLEMHGPSSKYFVESTLTANQSKSLYEINHVSSKDNVEGEIDDGSGEILLKVKSNENEFVFKNLDSKEMFYSDVIGLKEFYIDEKIPKMIWKLAKERKEVLGYECQKATTLYKGRRYIAYFTTELPINNGPWHFYGLPGMILEVKSEEGKFRLLATNLKLINKKTKIDNPYEKKEIVSWEDFLLTYKKKYDEVKRNGMTENGPAALMPKKAIVEYIKD